MDTEGMINYKVTFRTSLGDEFDPSSEEVGQHIKIIQAESQQQAWEIVSPMVGRQISQNEWLSSIVSVFEASEKEVWQFGEAH